MKLTSIHAGFLKLDGGAMFGIVPKRLWTRLTVADENNLCSWAMRCLLIETGNRKILVDTGMGNKQDKKWQSFFEPHGDQNLIASLNEAGVSTDEITDVFLTHLHFDHCGGSVTKNEKGDLIPTFANAVYWSNELHWNTALHPNYKEKASFLKENFEPLKKAGQLNFIKADKNEANLHWIEGIDIRFVYGHTEAMMLPIIKTGTDTVAYCADLIPSTFHFGKPYVMAYDVQPLETLKEKDSFLKDALENDWTLIFEHDPKTEAGKIHLNEKGKIGLKNTLNFSPR